MTSSIKNLFLLRFWPRSIDVGLLLLRLLVSGSLFLKHGWEKPAIYTNGAKILIDHGAFAAMATHFADPIHIGRVPSLLFALASDVICSALVMLGLATRWAALICVINIGAWSLVHHFVFFAVREGDHGETCVLYISVYLAIFFTGAGRYSMDEIIGKRA